MPHLMPVTTNSNLPSRTLLPILGVFSAGAGAALVGAGLVVGTDFVGVAALVVCEDSTAPAGVAGSSLPLFIALPMMNTPANAAGMMKRFFLNHGRLGGSVVVAPVAPAAGAISTSGAYWSVHAVPSQYR